MDLVIENMETRKFISRAINSQAIKEFKALLESFHSEFDSIHENVHKHIFLVEQMFSVFLSQNKEFDRATNRMIDCFSPMDNLDTGNASAEVFSPFYSKYKELANDPNEYRSYYFSQPLPDLQLAAKKFLIDQNIIPGSRVDDFSVVVGPGSVSLYDVVCRKLLKRSNDVVLMPVITYGFFIPQIQRSGGRAVFISSDNFIDKKVPALDIESYIKSINDSLLKSWIEVVDSHMRVYISRLENAGVIKKIEAFKSALNGFKKRVMRCVFSYEVDQIITDFMANEILKVDENRLSKLINFEDYPLPSPPRVVAYLHINPNVYGSVYTEVEIQELSKVFSKHRVSVIEDLAYNNMFLNDTSSHLFSFIPYLENTFCLFGLSKPFALANVRIGILLVNNLFARDLVRFVEDTVGFVSSNIQHALTALFKSPASSISEYLYKNNHDNYSLKRKIMIACFEGINSSKLSTEDSRFCRDYIENEINNFFKNKEEYGVYICDNDLINKFIDLSIKCEEFGEHDYHEFRDFTLDSFLKYGLSRWFSVSFDPKAGFFLIIDCSRLFAISAFSKNLTACSYDVFALMVYFFGVRTIPEECMGYLPSQQTKLLRFSFSCNTQKITHCLFTLFLGLLQIENELEKGY